MSYFLPDSGNTCSRCSNIWFSITDLPPEPWRGKRGSYNNILLPQLPHLSATFPVVFMSHNHVFLKQLSMNVLYKGEVWSTIHPSVTYLVGTQIPLMLTFSSKRQVALEQATVPSPRPRLTILICHHQPFFIFTRTLSFHFICASLLLFASIEKSSVKFTLKAYLPSLNNLEA